MKIATFNANSIRSRLPIVVPWLEKHAPDVLAIQETKVQDSEFPKEPLEAAGYSVVFKGQKAYNGVALLSREPLTNVTWGLPGDEEVTGPRLIRGEWRGIPIINTYVPQGRDMETEHFQYKLAFLGRFKAMLESEYTPDQPLIWLGDLNVAPAPEDVHDPKRLDGHACFNSVLTEKFNEVCGFGLKDSYRKLHQGTGHFTFFDYRMRGAVSRNTGWRIDLVMVTEPLYRRVSTAWIDLEPRKSKDPKPSDHTFLVIEFDM